MTAVTWVVAVAAKLDVWSVGNLVETSVALMVDYWVDRMVAVKVVTWA